MSGGRGGSLIMERITGKKWTAIIAVLLVLIISRVPARAQEMLYDGDFVLQPNGDMQAVVKLTLPMEQYDQLKTSVSNLYLLLRDLSSNRADVEIDQTKADWDDQHRTVTFTIHMLGAARNMGNYWSCEVDKDATFSNLDETKKIVYFNENYTTEAGAIKGTSRIEFPKTASSCKYDASKHQVTYVLPRPGGRSGSLILLIIGGLLTVLGLAAVAGSFIIKKK